MCVYVCLIDCVCVCVLCACVCSRACVRARACGMCACGMCVCGMCVCMCVRPRVRGSKLNLLHAICRPYAIRGRDHSRSHYIPDRIVLDW